jgi:hypothetical protein
LYLEIPTIAKPETVGSNAMSDTTFILKLDNYEAEDIGDVVSKLENSFGIKFSNETFTRVKTFGELCDVFEAHVTYENYDDCTKQQAFYKIRKAVSSTHMLDEREITLDTELSALFPKHNRRQKIREFQTYLGVKVRILTYPDWLALALVLGIFLSLIAFFFDWKVAVIGLTFFSLSIRFAGWFGKTFLVETVRQLTERTVREHYSDIRRREMTVNRTEVVPIIIETFSSDLDIDKTNLTRDAKFSWA